jgi:hypothetical protein
MAFFNNLSSTAAKTAITEEAKIMIIGNPTAPGASSVSAMETKSGMSPT